MDNKKNKGLADNQEGEFILNESGTSVTVDSDIVYPEDRDDNEPVKQKNEDDKDSGQN